MHVWMRTCVDKCVDGGGVRNGGLCVCLFVDVDECVHMYMSACVHVVMCVSTFT